MQNKTLTFQLATHSLSRVALRLEYLFQVVRQATKESHETIHRYALKSLAEITELGNKPELKSRFLKEMIRIEYLLQKANASIDKNLLEDLSQLTHELNHFSGAFGRQIHEHHFLKTMRQIHQAPSRECEFNSPHLLIWLSQDSTLRQNEFLHWLDLLSELQQTVTLYLSLLRTTSYFSSIMTHQGYYQYSLPSKITCHLVQLKIDREHNLIPRLQLGHHGLTIRLQDPLSAETVKNRSVEMDIAVCQL